MTDDLVKELRKAADRNPGNWVCDMCGEAADRIEALEAENERLLEALEWANNVDPDLVSAILVHAELGAALKGTEQ